MIDILLFLAILIQYSQRHSMINHCDRCITLHSDTDTVQIHSMINCCDRHITLLSDTDISHFWDRPVPIFSDVRFSYLALVQDKKITCILPANPCCTSLVRERLKSYPRVSEISLSCTPPMLDSIYLLLCLIYLLTFLYILCDSE